MTPQMKEAWDRVLDELKEAWRWKTFKGRLIFYAIVYFGGGILLTILHEVLKP